ncbi:MAG TPA: glycosyltransferase [Anaerolineae bacterium]|nr:glycosyltransferase [Anaerolineae bacterium]
MDQVQHESGETLPAMSAIVPIREQYASVRKTMRYLQKQAWANQLEVVFVVPRDGSPNIETADLQPFHSWRVATIEKFGTLARAYAAGTRHASAPIVVWTEDHSFPQANWAETLITSHQMPVAAVGPAMRNGNPTSLASWADFYTAYGEWAEPIESGEVNHLPGHNSSYKKDLLLEYGERLEEVLEAESLLHWDLRRRKYVLYLTNQTSNAHLNHATWRIVLPSHFYTGRQFAALRASQFSPARRLLFILGAPLIPFVRFYRAQGPVRRARRSLIETVAILAAVLFAFTADGLGEMVGYAFGVGNAHTMRAEHEYDRIDHLTPQQLGRALESDV